MSELLTQAVFLVGGKGSRLGALSSRLPKPLLEVGGRPFLDYLVLEVVRHGMDRLLLLAGHLGVEIERYAERWRALGVEVKCLIEARPAGTAGALHIARQHLDERFLLFNGDSLLCFNFLDLLTGFGPGRWLARVALRQNSVPARYGEVDLRGDKIHAFREKSDSRTGIVNAGVYLVHRGILDHVRLPPCSLENDVFPEIAAAGFAFGRVYQAPFIDIGVPDDYSRAAGFVDATIGRRYCVFMDMAALISDKEPDLLPARPLKTTTVQFMKQVNDSGGLIAVFARTTGCGEEYELRARRHCNQALQPFGVHLDEVLCEGGANEPRAEAIDAARRYEGRIGGVLRKWQIDARFACVASAGGAAMEAAARLRLPNLGDPSGSNHGEPFDRLRRFVASIIT